MYKIHICSYVRVIYYTMLTGQSEVTVMQSDDSQSRQDNESNQSRTY